MLYSIRNYTFYNHLFKIRKQLNEHVSINIIT